MTALPMTQLLKLDQVKAETTLSRSTIYRLIDQGQFPTPVHLSANRRAWRMADIEAWKQARAA